MQDGRCYAHSELVDEERRTEARSQGGRNTSRVAVLERRIHESPDLSAVYSELVHALGAVLSGELSPPRASAAASVARALAELRRTAELEGRVAMLEGRAAA